MDVALPDLVRDCGDFRTGVSTCSGILSELTASRGDGLGDARPFFLDLDALVESVLEEERESDRVFRLRDVGTLRCTFGDAGVLVSVPGGSESNVLEIAAPGEFTPNSTGSSEAADRDRAMSA